MQWKTKTPLAKTNYNNVFFHVPHNAFLFEDLECKTLNDVTSKYELINISFIKIKIF